MGLALLIDWIARIGVAFYFLWATWFNIKSWDHHIAEFKRLGVGPAAPALAVGLVAMAAGGLLILVPQTVVIGAALLIIFTVGADALFHRYWTYSDPGERVTHQFFLFEHVALIGGLLAIIAPRLS